MGTSFSTNHVSCRSANQSIQSFSNPLRHATEIRQQLAEIEQLRAEQEQLEKQFGQFGTAIDKELSKVKVECENELTRLRSKTSARAEAVRVAAASRLSATGPAS